MRGALRIWSLALQSSVFGSGPLCSESVVVLVEPEATTGSLLGLFSQASREKQFALESELLIRGCDVSAAVLRAKSPAKGFTCYLPLAESFLQPPCLARPLVKDLSAGEEGEWLVVQGRHSCFSLDCWS